MMGLFFIGKTGLRVRVDLHPDPDKTYKKNGSGSDRVGKYLFPTKKKLILDKVDIERKD